MAEEAIYGLLSADDDILDYVRDTAYRDGGEARTLTAEQIAQNGIRIFPNFRPIAPTMAFPMIVYRRAATEGPQTLESPSELVSGLFVVDCVQPDQVDDPSIYGYIKELADVVRLLMDGEDWTAGGVKVASCELQDEEDTIIKLTSEDVRGAFTIRLTFEIWYYET